MTYILDVMHRELRILLTHKRLFVIFFIVIMFHGVYYPQPYSSEVLRDAAMGIVDLDDTTSSRKLARDIDASGSAEVVAKLPDAEAAKRAVFERRISGYLLIPKYFERDLLAGRQSPVALYADASYFLINQNVKSAVSSAIQNLSVSTVASRLVPRGMTPEAGMVAASPFQLNAIPLFNPEGGYVSYVVPAVFLLIFQQIMLMGVGLINTMPDTATVSDGRDIVKTIIGKLLSYLVPAAFMFVLATIIVPYFYSISRIGSFQASLAIGVPFALAASALGLMIAAIFKDALTVQIVCSVLGTPLFFMAGVAWPQEAMPAALQSARYLIPSSSGIDGIVRINQMNADVGDVSPDVIRLWCLVVLYSVATWLIVSIRHRRKASSAAPMPTA